MAILTIAICSIDIYDVKAAAYYFMKANLATGMICWLSICHL